MKLWLLAFAILLGSALSASAGEKMKVIRVGIIGLDTSHVTAFTNVLNNPKTDDVAGFKVVAAFPGGSPDVPASKNRIEGFTKQLKEKYGVEIVNSIDELLAKVDVVLLESVDGRQHLEQVIPVLKAGKRVFIDKPIGGTLADALKIFELSAQYKVPLFSASSLRYSPWIKEVKENPKNGAILGCTVYGPCEIQSHMPDMFWYGIHGIEALYAIMGTGCQSVTRTHSPEVDVITGQWKDGRAATFRGIRKGKTDYGAMVFAEKAIVPNGNYGGYQPLLVEICKYFKTGVPPVSAEETIELFAFMEAADESKRQGGALVTLESVLKKARAQK